MLFSFAMILCLLLAAAVSWSLVAPHMSNETLEHGSGEESEELASLLDQKERCIQVLRDLELDFGTGKVQQEEYEQMKSRVTAEVGQLLERIEGFGNV